MKVLIADFDIFAKVGGGQTFYRSLILKNPEINFYYLNEQETVQFERPKNAHIIPYRQIYLVADLKPFFDIVPPKGIHRAFVMASNIAASVAGERFDIIDVPDYDSYGMFLRPALNYHRVEFDKIALSMHGKISTTLKLNWFNLGESNIPLELAEKMQYQTVDLRYGISKSYLEEWRSLVDLDAYYYHPLHFLDLPKPTLSLASERSPRLNFIGRTEKRKGPDIFVDLVWWIDRQCYSDANIIGPDSYDEKEGCSGDYLRRMIAHRLKTISLLPPMNRQELTDLFASKTITFLPSRYDTFNLIALESLFSGCPTAIGSGAGVCRFLRDNFPEVPWISIDMNGIYSCLPEIYQVLDHYDEYREKLVTAFLNSFPTVSDPLLEALYQNPPSWQQETRQELDRWYSQQMGFWQASQGANWSKLKAAGVKFLKTNIKPIYKKGKKSLKSLKKNFLPPSSPPLPSAPARTEEIVVVPTAINSAKPVPRIILIQMIKSPFLISRYQQLFHDSETTAQDLRLKLQQSWNLAGANLDLKSKTWLEKFAKGYRCDRVRQWREIARLEQLRGNEIIAATYKLRTMRLLGEDLFGDCLFVERILTENGFPREAEVVNAMYGDPAQTAQLCRQILDSALLDNANSQTWEYEFIDDRRQKFTYRASIIVSLYNAADKLPLFLKSLQFQTLLQQQDAEIILIDSGSPTDEYKVFQQLASQLNIPLVYARSQQRETIQSAWNRGISLSRAPYLAFLGVDEMIVPDCLDVLVAELDSDSSLDWVIGHSLVTNVDRQGNWVNDVMSYDRRGYQQDLVYLETCYLSWVGALYRRSIHDRFGYYDASFRAAGDTEFKNRILPFIQTKVVDRTLGIFWNYPEERTTQSPLAEIEDIRAWYLHRTLSGIKYAFATRKPEDAEKLLYAALGYRKSYCHHVSTDIEYAYNLSLYLQETKSGTDAINYFGEIQTLFNAYRDLDWMPKLSRTSPGLALWKTWNLVNQVENQHRAKWNLQSYSEFQPTYQIFNDNRHEQHAFLWFTENIIY